MIYTSYFGKLKKLEDVGIIPVAVCQGIPSWYSGLDFDELKPSWTDIKEMRLCGRNSYAAQHYRKQLSHLDKESVRDFLNSLGDVALICWETPDKFCHKQLIAEWLGGIEEWTENV